MKNRLTILMALLTVAAAPSWADNHEALIALARSAAPDLVSADATVVFRGEVLAEGTNGWICLPETLPDGRTHVQ